MAAWEVAEVVARITGERLDPARVNPYRVEPPKSDALRRIEAYQRRVQWRAMFGSRGS